MFLCCKLSLQNFTLDTQFCVGVLDFYNYYEYYNSVVEGGF
jgi:hypothetical protein